jgi:predicted nucleic acid-binding protein
MKINRTTTSGIDEKIQKSFHLIAKIIQEFRELVDVQKELFAVISQLSPLPPEHNFSTYDREQKEYFDSFWGTD